MKSMKGVFSKVLLVTLLLSQVPAYAMMSLGSRRASGSLAGLMRNGMSRFASNCAADQNKNLVGLAGKNLGNSSSGAALAILSMLGIAGFAEAKKVKKEKAERARKERLQRIQGLRDGINKECQDIEAELQEAEKAFDDAHKFDNKTERSLRLCCDKKIGHLRSTMLAKKMVLSELDLALYQEKLGSFFKS
jgi:hypothetical protein